ncbi:J domain-containing protein [Sulfobacillus thermosulfidooxidans]|uniref:J domain-containing protein n=1 Tax=Sulfobacillus thermosulfidooxidans TaxID=28034 RepID=UPI0006B654C3|nr:J domain-containing protein [Sulfobacillus thermosulfidooxidans]
MTRQDAADLLGIPVDASPEMIKQAYRKQCGRLHPDAGGESSQFQLLTRARDILLTPPHQHPTPPILKPLAPSLFPLWSYPLRLVKASVRQPSLRPRALRTWLMLIIGIPLGYLLIKELFMLAIIPVLFILIVVAFLKRS